MATADVETYQAVIVKVKNVHALSDFLIYSIQLSFNAA